MALKDNLLQKKVDLQRAINSKRIKVSNTVRMSDASAKSASRMTKQMAPTADEFILQLISLIDTKASTGQFTVVSAARPAFIQKVSNYFKSRKYITLRVKQASTEYIVISWVGGKNWRKMWLEPEVRKQLSFVGTTARTKIMEEIFKVIDPNKPYSMTWLNPKITNQLNDYSAGTLIARVTESLP